jgi:hypothetical protein
MRDLNDDERIMPWILPGLVSCAYGDPYFLQSNNPNAAIRSSERWRNEYVYMQLIFKDLGLTRNR